MFFAGMSLMERQKFEPPHVGCYIINLNDGFFGFGEFAVEGGQGDAKEVRSFFFVAVGLGEGAVEVSHFLVA